MQATPRGRGTGLRPENRFDRFHVQRDGDYVDPDPHVDGEPPRAPTVLLRDTSRTVLCANDSEDVAFDVSVNPYRGCAHGCTYCYARPFHEYLGLDAGLDFETKLLVKPDAPALLERELRKPRYEPKPIAMSGVTDPYQPVERELSLTRGCLEVLRRFRHPVGIVTKNHLITRDIDILADLAQDHAALAAVSVTTLDASLQRDMEPRASSPRMRLDAIRRLAEAGIPTAVMVAPVVPGLTDSEIPAILEAARDAGARHASWIMLRLPHAVKSIFEDWLTRARPLRRDKVLSLVRSMRGGRLYDARPGVRMRGEGAYATHVARLFESTRRRLGYDDERTTLSTTAFRRPGGQLSLFETA
ncbi:MAG: PA0069 family radical SAM protein [Planctomycetota bacterium]|nr:PA0069 family radical SAM protein [Planctomycetota bacterium]